MLALPGHTSEQRTLSKTQNNHLTGKAPYKFESALLQRRVRVPLVPVGTPNAASDEGAQPPSRLSASRSISSAGFVTATLRARIGAKARQASCRCDGILPLCGSFGPEDPQLGPKNHKLIELWQLFVKVAAAFGYDYSDATVVALSGCIDEFAAVDPSSTAF